jgi:hypothetical protein
VGMQRRAGQVSLRRTLGHYTCLFLLLSSLSCWMVSLKRFAALVGAVYSCGALVKVCVCVCVCVGPGAITPFSLFNSLHCKENIR